jgi:hypothetical protein
MSLIELEPAEDEQIGGTADGVLWCVTTMNSQSPQAGEILLQEQIAEHFDKRQRGEVF